MRQSIITINNIVHHSIGLLQIVLIICLIIVLYLNALELKRKRKGYKINEKSFR